MIPRFNKDGNLPAGVHKASWGQFRRRFGWNRWRKSLLRGMKRALDMLRRAKCATVYIDGSFVTSKDHPKDYDGCWSPVGVDPQQLDPIFYDPIDPAAQKLRYLGELYPDLLTEGNSGMLFVDFFQNDKATGGRKGVVAIDLKGL